MTSIILFQSFYQQKDIDIYIETTEFLKYKKKYNAQSFKYSKYYPSSFYSMKFIWKEININLIFVKNNMAMIEEFDFDFCKIFYSFCENSIFAYYTLFEFFDNKFITNSIDRRLFPCYLNIYENNLLQIQMLWFSPKGKNLNDNFIRYEIFRYIKYAFKGFYEKEEEKKIRSIISYYEEILLNFLNLL